MHIATIADLVISADTMHQYVVGTDALKTIMCMLSNELDRGAKSVYSDATEARDFFQKYVSTEYMDYQAWHQFTTVYHREDVEELVFPQLYESQ